MDSKISMVYQLLIAICVCSVLIYSIFTWQPWLILASCTLLTFGIKIH
jgi:hypothetical protein